MISLINVGVSGLISAGQIERQGKSITLLETAPQLGGRCARQEII
jgi:monoamine oxidase